MNQVTSASLRYPLSVFNKNSSLNRLAEHGSPQQAYPYAGFRPFPLLVLPLPDAAAGLGGYSWLAEIERTLSSYFIRPLTYSR